MNYIAFYQIVTLQIQCSHVAHIVVERFWHSARHLMCQLISCSIKGIENVTTNQTLIYSVVLWSCERAKAQE